MKYTPALQPQSLTWEDRILNKLADYICQEDSILRDKIIRIERDPINVSSFVLIWKQNDGEIQETKIFLDRKDKTFCFRNGAPRTVKSIEALLPSIFDHCDISS